MRRNRKRSLTPFLAGMLALIVAVVVVYLGFTKAIPFQHHYTIQAAFRTANNVKKGSPVRIAGVNVGKVTGVQPLSTASGQPGAVVAMQIQDQGLPIHADAHAAIRPRIFLEGNFFVDLRPGTPSAPILKDGGTLPVQNNTAPVQFDQILGVLHASTRDNLQVLVAELAKGLSGPGGMGYNKALQYQPSAFKNGAIVNDATLGQNPHDLSGYVNGGGATAAAIDRNPAALQNLLTDFNTTAAAFASQQSNLKQTIAELPRTLHAAQPAFASLNAAFPAVRRLVSDLRPAVRSSGPTLDVSIPLFRQLRSLVSKPELRGLVHDLRPTVPALARLNRATVPLLQQTRLFSSCQNQVVLPYTHQTIPDNFFPATGQVFQEFPKPLNGLAGEAGTGDANGFWLRVLLNAGNATYKLGSGSFFQTALPIMGVNPPKSLARPPLRPDVPCETQKPPSLATVPGAAPAQVKTSMSSPRAQAMYAQARAGTVRYLQAHSRAITGQAAPATIPDITPAQIQQLAAQTGHVGQLNQLPALLRRAPTGGPGK